MHAWKRKTVTVKPEQNNFLSIKTNTHSVLHPYLQKPFVPLQAYNKGLHSDREKQQETVYHQKQTTQVGSCQDPSVEISQLLSHLWYSMKAF